MASRGVLTRDWKVCTHTTSHSCSLFVLYSFLHLLLSFIDLSIHSLIHSCVSHRGKIVVVCVCVCACALLAYSKMESSQNTQRHELVCMPNIGRNYSCMEPIQASITGDVSDANERMCCCTLFEEQHCMHMSCAGSVLLACNSQTSPY